MFKLKKKPQKTVNKASNNELELVDKNTLVSTKDSGKVILTYIIFSIALTASILGNLFLVYFCVQLATREKIYVARQTEIEIAEEKDPYFRPDKVIHETITDFLNLSHEWDATLPDTKVKDPGVKITGENSLFRVPSKTYAASYLLEIGFRRQFLEQFSAEIDEDYYQGRLTSDLKIYHLGKPERFKDNLYRVKVIMTRTERRNESETKEVQFTQIIHLQATQPHKLTLGDKDPSNFRKNISQILRNGLIIYEITPVSS